MNTNERISVLIETLGIRQKDFADKIHLKPNTLSMIKSNKRNVTERVIRDICREFHVNEAWLTKGEGEIFQPEEHDAIDELIKQYRLNTRDREILHYFVRMTPENRELFYRFISSINQKWVLEKGAHPASSFFYQLLSLRGPAHMLPGPSFFVKKTTWVGRKTATVFILKKAWQILLFDILLIL